jgi:radical SAM superfamily enzyme YgiQ (UPF0313 family)
MVTDEQVRRMRLFMKKGINVPQTRKAFQLCHEVGIRTFANIPINFPGENEDDINKTLLLLDEIKPDGTSFNIFVPFLGTDIHNAHSVNLTPEEYSLLGLSPLELIKDKRFVFAEHNINFREFYAENHKKFNRLISFVHPHLSLRYLRTFGRSAKKIEYLKQIPILLKEIYL